MMAAWHYIRGRWWVFALPLSVFTLVGAALIVLHVVADPVPPRPWYESFLLMGLVFVAVPWVGTALVLLRVRKGQVEERHLHERGMAGTAILVSAEETGLFTNDIPEISMVLDISTPGNPGYRITHRDHVSPVHIHRLVPGAEIPVLVDPLDRERVLLRLDRSPEDRASGGR